MSSGLNKVILLGNLGLDPEVRYMSSGKMMVLLRVATMERWNDKISGERKEKAEWHRVTIFSEEFAKLAEKWLRKGCKVYIEGRLETRKWTDKKDEIKYSTEVIVPPYGGKLLMLDNLRGERREIERKDEPPPKTDAFVPDDEIPF